MSGCVCGEINTRHCPVHASSDDVAATLAEIEANQRAFTSARSLRRQYKLLRANEDLFARLGVTFPPLKLSGLFGWWVRL